MFHKNQNVRSLRKWWRHSEQPAEEKFAFGWRSAFSAAINALRSGAALAAGLRRFLKDQRAAPRPLRRPISQLRGTQGAAVIEFAVALPLLIVLVVGIFDFGGAFNLKQELNNAVREGARFGAAQATNDLSVAPPPSVSAIRFVVDSYLLRAHLNDCGLSTAPEVPVSGSVWQFTGSTGCTTTLTISRQVPLQVTVSGTQVTMLCTTVQISYPYQWHFNNVIQLLVPGANYTLGNIQSDATAANMD